MASLTESIYLRQTACRRQPEGDARRRRAKVAEITEVERRNRDDRGGGGEWRV